MFLCIHQWFLHGFVLLSASSFTYKYISLANLSGNGLAGDVAVLLFYAVLENFRLYQSSKGNKTKKRAPLVVATVLAVPALVCNSFFVQLQTHVLQLERILNSYAMVLLGIEVVLAVLTLLWLFSTSTV